MASAWDPALYRRFEDERTRPAQDLLARVPLSVAARVVDLGCGPGNSTELLAARFPRADVLGTDTSQTMLDSARERLPQCRFELRDVSTWQPEAPPELIFANAVLQWVPDHALLLPRLFASLPPGGVLALQMPDNLAEPSHRLMREVALDAPFASAIRDASNVRAPVLAAELYYDLLAANASQIDVWRTVYHHPLSSAAAIVDWLRATGLRPFLEPLTEAQRVAFTSQYEKRIAAAYPPRVDGQRLLAFPRLFIVAQRRL